MKINNMLVLVICFLALSQNSHASETGYEVELIIFETNASHQLESEDWSYNDMLNNDKDIAETKNNYQDNNYTELNWQDAKLANSLEKIESSSRYTVLYKKRWRQTGLDRDTAYAIDITSLKNAENSDDNTVTTETKNTISDADILTMNNKLSMDATEDQTYIQGRVKLIMSRYLHFEVNLNYFKMMDDEENSGYRSYPVISERRMRSRETHYIDHPMVGIIVHALPFKIETEVIPDKINNVSSAKTN